MPQFGGKDSKRHFTVVIGGKEHGLYISLTPSSAARKAVTKLCASNKSKKVEFSMREITQDSKKKTYGPYKGHIEKLKEPIELKGRVIRYKPVAKLSGKKGAKKGGKDIYELQIEQDNLSIRAIKEGLDKIPTQEKIRLGINNTSDKILEDHNCYYWRFKQSAPRFKLSSTIREDPIEYYLILKIKTGLMRSSIYIAFRIQLEKIIPSNQPEITIQPMSPLVGRETAAFVRVNVTVLAIGGSKKEFADNLNNLNSEDYTYKQDLIQLIIRFDFGNNISTRDEFRELKDELILK